MPETSFPATRCPECEALYGHEPVLCRECRCETLTTEPISSRGEVYAATTIHVPGIDHQGEEPFVVGLVDVGADETVRVTARVETDDDTPLSAVTPGISVEFVAREDDVFYFRVA